MRADVSSTYAGWHGHVIVCGLHGVGLRIVELLNASGVPTVSSTTTRTRGWPAT